MTAPLEKRGDVYPILKEAECRGRVRLHLVHNQHSEAGWVGLCWNSKFVVRLNASASRESDHGYKAYIKGILADVAHDSQASP